MEEAAPVLSGIPPEPVAEVVGRLVPEAERERVAVETVELTPADELMWAEPEAEAWTLDMALLMAADAEDAAEAAEETAEETAEEMAAAAPPVRPNCAE